MMKWKKIAVIGILVIVSISMASVVGLYTLSESISNLTQETQTLQTELTNKMNVLENTNVQLTNTLNEIKKEKQNLDETIGELKKLQAGNRYTLHDPLYFEALNFIRSDRTNTKPYDEDTFNCMNYAQEVNNNAEKNGMRCAFVSVNLSVSGHALVAFNTTDRGVVYFEPQDDHEVKLQVGKDYWADCVVPTPGYYYERDPSWIIEDFELYW